MVTRGAMRKGKKAFNVGRGSIPIHQVMQRCQNCTCINQKRQTRTNSAKKKARAQGFRYMDQVFKDKPCMSKPVNVMTYDMQPFLQSCIDRYQSLAGKDSRLWPLRSMRLKERIARPEPNGVLAPIAAWILMKILFAARMARYDLLRAASSYLLHPFSVELQAQSLCGGQNY